jgi:HlyD family secretion protein
VKKLIVLLLIVGAGLALAALRPSPAPPGDAGTAESLEFGSIAETVSAAGAVQPRDGVAVGSDAAGRIVRVFAEVGHVVKVNDALAQFDDRLAQVRLQQARLAVELAQAEMARAHAGRDAAALGLQRARETHVQLNTPAPRDAESAELTLRGAEAGLKAAGLRVREAQAAQQLAELAADATVVRSPIAGVVLERRAVAGQHAGPPLSAHLFTVAPNQELAQVVAPVAEADVAKVRVGQVARFTVNAWPDDTFEGRVTRVASVPAGAPGAVQYPVTVDVTNLRGPGGRDWKLRPGMPAAVDVVIRRHERVWKLPAAAAAVQLDEAALPEAARKKLGRWKSRGDRADWQRVWLVTADGAPWPLYLRIGGKDANGEPGLSDGQFVEVLAWDPEETPPPPEKPPRVLTAAPDALKPAKPALKFF